MTTTKATIVEPGEESEREGKMKVKKNSLNNGGELDLSILEWKDYLRGLLEAKRRLLEKKEER